MASSVPVIGDGRYELIEPLSSGGMGQVWRGFDTVLDREIAVKLIRPDVISTAEQAEEFAKRFRREARITARIRHHGVPQVHDALLEPSFEQVYLVMELVHGTPLHAFIDPARPLPIGWVAAVTAQICTVLSHAHALPVVHRDLKPDNVMLCPDGTVKLLDFGIAAILRSDVSRITSTGTPIGTNHYMAPEQILGGQVAPYTDLYALGCLLHELLSGQHVFDGGNEFELWQQHLSSPPPPLRSIRSDVPEPMEALVLHLLAKAPEQRPADAYEVYERLLPSLPGPGEPPAGEARAAPHGNGPPLPDPTLLYRRPNPPLPRAAAAPAGPEAETSGHDDVRRPAAPTQLRSAIATARAHAAQLARDGRIAQATEALDSVIAEAGEILGDHREVLSLRQMRAAVYMWGGDYRRALPEFTSLARTYARRNGPEDSDAVDCASQAARCLAELGRTAQALSEFERLLPAVRRASGDVSEEAVDVRRSIGVLLIAEGRTVEAEAQLRDLLEDLRLVYSPDHEDLEELTAMIAQIRPNGTHL